MVEMRNTVCLSRGGCYRLLLSLCLVASLSAFQEVVALDSCLAFAYDSMVARLSAFQEWLPKRFLLGFAYVSMAARLSAFQERLP